MARLKEGIRVLTRLRWPISHTRVRSDQFVLRLPLDEGALGEVGLEAQRVDQNVVALVQSCGTCDRQLEHGSDFGSFVEFFPVLDPLWIL